MRESEDEQSLEFAMRQEGATEPPDDADFLVDDADTFDSGDDEASNGLADLDSHGDCPKTDRKFAIRRAIERRMEQKALDRGLDYLECDLDG